MKHIFHKWEYFDKPVKRTFLNVVYSDVEKAFRRCRKCGNVQTYYCFGEKDGYSWSNLDEKEKKIFHSKIADFTLRTNP